MNVAAVSGEMARALDALRYPFVGRDLPLYDPAVIPYAHVVGFGSRPSQKTACIAGQFCPVRLDRDQYLSAMAPIGVRYVYLGYSDGSGEVVRLEREGIDNGLAPRRLGEVPLANVARYLAGSPSQFGPRAVIGEKFRALPPEQRGPPPWQLSFASAGLLDLQEEQTEESLVRLLHRCVAAATEAWRVAGTAPDDADSVTGRVFLRLVAACALADKGITHADRSELAGTVAEARKVLSSFMAPQELGRIPNCVLEVLWARIQEVRFELLTGDMLAGVYEKGLLTPQEQRQEGVHYTPPSVRRFLWNLVVDNLRDFPTHDRIVLDPACGSGGFLLTACEGLALLEGIDRFCDYDVAAFRRRIFGVDQDEFACDMARLALILESQPVTNNWGIQRHRFQEWEPPEGRRPRLVIGNPPFARQQAAQMLQRAMEWLVPGGTLALVMPRSFLTNVSMAKTREAVGRWAEDLSVVELPEKVFGTSQASTCVLVGRRASSAGATGATHVRFRALNASLAPVEQRQRLAAGDTAFARPGERLPVADFVHPQFALGTLFAEVRTAQRVSDIAELHEGIHLRGRKGAAAADVSDGPQPGYLPYVENAKRHIEPFRITRVRYIEWTPERMYSPGRLAWWQPGKVLLYGNVSGKQQRWRLVGALDDAGLAYGCRVLGCRPRSGEWSPAALLGFLTSNYANAWYSVRGHQLRIIATTLYQMPVPELSEDQAEHLSALGLALGACAGAYAASPPTINAGTYAYVMRALLGETDCLVCAAAGLDDAQRSELDQYLAAAGRPRPGLPVDAPEHGVSVARPGRDGDSDEQLGTTGLVLTTDASRSLAIVWLDSLDLGIPICIPVGWLPHDARAAGRAIEARVTLEATSPSDVAISDIRFLAEGHIPRRELGKMLAGLAAS